MKFACDQCHSKYSIADEKIRGKILRIRCKKCGHIVEVRDHSISASGASGSPAGPFMATEAPRPASRAAASSAPAAVISAASPRNIDDELERAFGRVVAESEGNRTRLAGRVAEPIADTDKTVLFDYSRDFFDAARGEAEAATAPQAPEPSEVVEWYLAIDGQQIGPLPIAEAQARLLAEDAAERAYAWRDGLADWARIADVPELRSLLPAPPAEPPPQAPVIEAMAVASEGGVALFAADAGAPEPRAEAPLLLDLEKSPPVTPSGTEPISLRRLSVAGREAHGDLDFPTAVPTEAPSVALRQRHRISVGTLALLVFLLILGIVLLLGAFDIVPLPFVGSDSTATVGRGGTALDPASTQQRLGRDPLLDRDAPQIVVQQVPSSSKMPTRNRRNGRPREVAGTPAPAAPPTPAPAPTAAPSPAAPPALSALEKKIYGGGTGLPDSPRVPEHLVAKTTVPLESERGLSQEVITEVIRKYRSGIQNCYDRQLRRDASVKGRLTLSLRIGRNGRVQSAGVESKMRSTIVGQCVVQLAQTWRFPPSGGDVEVDYPLILEQTQ